MTDFTPDEQAYRIIKWSSAHKLDAHWRAVATALEDYDVDELAFALAVAAQGQSERG